VRAYLPHTQFSVIVKQAEVSFWSIDPLGSFIDQYLTFQQRFIN
jgi:hypothetical protein